MCIRRARRTTTCSRAITSTGREATSTDANLGRARLSHARPRLAAKRQSRGAIVPNPDPAGVEILILDLKSPDRFVRANAARRLVNLKEEAACAWPHLLALSGDTYEAVRAQI